MIKKTVKFYKKIPLRKCVVSNQVLPKKELIRIVKNKDGQIFIDRTGKVNGRGVYIQPKITLVLEAKKTKVLEKNLKSKITEDIYQKIIFEIENYWD